MAAILLMQCLLGGCMALATNSSNTGSRGAIGKCTPTEADFVLYNRIPKCASTTLLTLLRKLARQRSSDNALVRGEKRHFHVTNAQKQDFKMELPFQNNTQWSAGWARLAHVANLATARHGEMYINHVHWPNMSVAGFRRPYSMQVMREPVAREVSAFYYVMWGPRQEADMRASRSRFMRRTGLDHPPNINEYMAWSVAQHGRGCLHTGNMQTRYFCGFHADCSDICSEKALTRAKTVLDSEYNVVGLVEQFSDTLRLLQVTLPSWFTGLLELYNETKRREGHGHMRTGTTSSHPTPTADTAQMLREHHVQDMKLYSHAVKNFKRQLARCGIDPI